jgi:hypothetical protein
MGLGLVQEELRPCGGVTRAAYKLSSIISTVMGMHQLASVRRTTLALSRRSESTVGPNDELASGARTRPIAALEPDETGCHAHP